MSHPVLDQLLLRPPIREVLQVIRRELTGIYGDRLVHAVLFGSQARGQAHDESDVDVLVVLRGEVDVLHELRRLSPLATRLLVEHGVAVSLQPYAAADFAAGRQPFIRAVQGDGIEL